MQGAYPTQKSLAYMTMAFAGDKHSFSQYVSAS